MQSRDNFTATVDIFPCHRRIGGTWIYSLLILEVADSKVPWWESQAVVKVMLLPQHRVKVMLLPQHRVTGPQPAVTNHCTTRVIGRRTDLGTSWEVCTRPPWRLGRDLGGW